jgi:hypothetical protein
MMTTLARALIILVSFAWFPHSLERVHRLGYDFTIYWMAGQGVLRADWVYSDHLAPVFLALGALPHDVGFAVLYSLSVLAWLSFAGRVPGLALLAAYPMLLSLELGQITPVLAWLCLSPLGSIVAAWFKPYLAVFVVVHAVVWTNRARAARRWARGEGVRKG